MIDKTYKEAGFDDAVQQIIKLDIGLPNDNFLKAFVLPIVNCAFDYQNLKELVANNVKNYVFSRKEIQNANVEDKAEALYNKALRRFREIKNDKDKGNGSELGEIILYLFMEHYLNAPKIFSKMELKTNKNDYIKGADGVFLRKYSDGDITLCDLIIGESKIENDLSRDINDVFKSIKTHLDASEYEVELVNENLFKETFSEEELEEIKKIIVPTAKPTEKNVSSKSFGIFIGYSLKVKLSGISNLEGEKRINEKILKDAKRIVEKFKLRISEEKLDHYSFYVYILPFNDAEGDRKKIMKEIIG